MSDEEVTPTEFSREAWLEARRHFVTATDAVAIMGASPYATRFSVYCEKAGLTEGKQSTEQMDFGKEIEEIVARKFTKRTGLEHEWLNSALYKSLLYPWLACTPDALVVGSKDLIEVKTVGFNSGEWGEEGTDKIPERVKIQCQVQMAVMDADSVYVALYETGPRRLKIYRVYRNEPMIEEIVGLCETFWFDHVLKGVAPEIDFSEAADEILRKRFPFAKEDREPIDADPVQENLVHEYIRAHQAQKKWDQIKHDYSNKIKEQIGEGKVLTGEGFNASWSNYPATSFMVNKKAGRTLRITGPLMKEDSASD